MPAASRTYKRSRDGNGKTQFTIWINSKYAGPLGTLAQQTGKSINALLVEFAERGGLKNLLKI